MFALASFDFEIREARLRARDPNLAALRLAWWRGVVRGERDEEAAGNPVAVALRAASKTFNLPDEALEAMLDARLQEIASQDDFTLAAFEALAAESEGAPLRLASRICAGGEDLDSAGVHAPAGMALALARMLLALPGKSGATPTVFPIDVASRHGASKSDIDARKASAAVAAACAELRALARAQLVEAEARLRASPRRSCPHSSRSARSASISTGWSVTPKIRSTPWRAVAAPAAMGDLALGPASVRSQAAIMISRGEGRAAPGA